MYVEKLDEFIQQARKEGYVKISIPWLTKKIDCTPEGRKICQGKCCRHVHNIMDRKKVYIRLFGWEYNKLPDEQKKLVINNIVQSSNGICSLMSFCIDNPSLKPVECKLAPLNFNKQGRLILDQWFTLHCPNYGKGDIPIYIALKDNLIDIFGEEVYNNIAKEIND